MLCLDWCHNGDVDVGEGDLAREQSAPERVRRLEAGSVNAFRLTKRAADKWESARFRAVCVA